MSATLFVGSKFYGVDPDGLPLAGGKVFTYAAGSLTPQATYTSQSGASPNTNPVTLDASGAADIWFGPYAYRIRITDAAGTLISDTDNITNPTAAVQLTQPTTDDFEGDGVTTVYTLSANPATVNNVFVGMQGALQHPGVDYTLSGIVLTFTEAPPDGVPFFANYTVALPVGTLDATALQFQAAGASAATRTGQSKLRDIVSVLDFAGADPTGVTDSSAAIAAALSASTHVDMRGGTWKISATVPIPAGRFIDMRGANIVLATGATPGFSFTGGNAGLYMLHGGGMVTGTASAFLFAQGTTDQPTNQNMYASQIHLESLWVSSATIVAALRFDDAVKSVYINGANLYTQSAIIASGKTVEVMIANSIFYSATGIAGTRGIQLRSTGGTTYYNEGWSIINSTIDNFEISCDITDVFVFNVTGSYIGCNATLAATSGYAFKFQEPTTSQCEELTIGAGTVIAGRVLFAASGSGRAYNARFSDFIMTNVPGTAIAIENNAASITVNDGKFKAGTGTAIGVVGSNNNSNIVCTDLDFDSTYTNGVVLNGANGTDCVIGPVSGGTLGDIIGAGRSNILYRDIPVHSAAIAAMNGTYSASNLGGGATYTVGATIASLAVGFARGESGEIVIHLPYSGANASTQNVQVTLPTGMASRSGTGWAATNNYLGAAAGLLAVRVPYYCTADGSGNVVVANQAGNTLTVPNQAYCGVERSW